MEVIAETYTKTVHVVKWNTAFPRAGYTSRTQIFHVNGVGWMLEFRSSILNNTEYWYLHLETVSIGNFRPFPVSLYFQHKGENNILSSNIINSLSQNIWTCDCASFVNIYPHIPVSDPNMLFILDFHEVAIDSENRAITLKVDKSVQAQDSTSSSEASASLENLSLDMSKLMDDSHDADVQFKCGDLTIGAHKLILGARSEVFKTMMQSDMLEGREGVVEIVDMEPRVLKALIRYLYTGILSEFTEDTIIPLYEAADKYQVEDLGKRSSHLLSKNLSQENALKILAVADAHDDKDLKSQVLAYVINNKVPQNDKNWMTFCNDYPKLVVDMFNFQLLSGPQ